MPRGPYNSAIQLDRDCLINAFEENQDWLTLAHQLEIKRQTARTVFTKGLTGAEAQGRPVIGGGQ